MRGLEIFEKGEPELFRYPQSLDELRVCHEQCAGRCGPVAERLDTFRQFMR